MINITITINDPDADRVRMAFARKWGLTEPATDEQIKTDLAAYIVQVSLNQEQMELVQDATEEGASLTPVVVS